MVNFCFPFSRRTETEALQTISTRGGGTDMNTTSHRISDLQRGQRVCGNGLDGRHADGALDLPQAVEPELVDSLQRVRELPVVLHDIEVVSGREHAGERRRL